MEYLPEEPTQPESDLPMINVMVTLGRPSSKELGKYNRAEKYKILKENSSERRRELMEWIEEHELADEVLRIGEPTAFNTLFIDCTERVAELLPDAPGVVSVAPTDDFEVDLSTSE